VDIEAPLAPLLLGVICLLHKPRQPDDEVSSYRPITLLNCDVKLVMLVMANRLQLPLEYLIDISQSAFLRGRDICDNVRYNFGLAARLAELGLPGWLLHSDLTKAYDSVNRGWLTKVLLTMGLKDAGIVRWTRILLNGSEAKVRVNGFFTAKFPVTSSLAQGSAVSCVHWLVVMQPFVSYLNQLASQGRMPTLALPGDVPAPAATSFADDNHALVLDPDGEGALLLKEAFGMFRKAGGPALSVVKTTLCPLVSDGRQTMDPAVHTHHLATGFRLRPADQVPRLLGVPFTTVAAVQATEAFGNMAGKIAAAGASWVPLLLNQTGRVHVARQCLASKPVYQANAAVPRPQDLVAMQQVINRFVARSGKKEEETPFAHRLFPNQRTMFLPADRGGVGLPHLESHFSAMVAKTAWLLFRHTQHPWQVLFRHETAQVAEALPGLPAGYHWPVTCPAAGAGRLGEVKSAMLKAALTAFMQLGIKRILSHEEQDFESIMVELTFYNPTPEHVAGVLPTDVQTEAARSWTRVRDVRAAHLRRDQLGQDEMADLTMIIGRLPQAWRAQVVTTVVDPSAWMALPVAADQQATFEGPDPVTRAVCLWELWPSGRLQKLPPGSPRPGGAMRPALVTYALKPPAAWDRADHEFVEAQRELPPSERVELLEPYLVGAWDSLQLDPRAWGIAHRTGSKVSLLDMSVKDARLQLTHRLLLRHRIPGYREEGAVWPKAWSVVLTEGDAGAAAPETTAGTLQLEQHGIHGQEELWRRRAAEQAGEVPGGEVDQVAGWFRRDAGLAPSQPRTTRTSQAAAAEEPAPPRQGFGRVWKRLKDTTIHRPFNITAWRILHCTLGCNAFLASSRPLGERSAEAALCGAPECTAAGQAETLTHAFLDCPEVRPAIDWLLDTWHSLTGRTVPRTARVLLADDQDGWPEGDRPPSADAYQLWTRLRVALLGAIWQVRCARDEGGGTTSFAFRAVNMAVKSLLDAIGRDWLRTHTDVRELDGGSFCHDWWRGFDVKLTVDDFIEAWASPPTFCEVRGEPPATPQETDTRTLHLRLGLDEPVARPGAAATGGGPATPPVPAPPPGPPVPQPAVPATAVQPPQVPQAGGGTQEDGQDTPPGEGCPICCRRLAARPVTRTACGHEFHLDCLYRWTARAATCPICRRGIPVQADPTGVG
jgi:hypothetical protein